MILLLRHQALLALMAAVIFFANLGSYALFNEDEPKNASCGAEMFRRGDLIVPTFNEALRTDKPILVYWLMITSYKLFGISEFSARFASSLLSVGTVLLTYHLGRKLYSAQVGLLSSCILCTCLLFTAVGRAATPDATLIFFVTLTFTSYVWIIAHQRKGNFSGELSGDESDETLTDLSDSDEIEASTNANVSDTVVSDTVVSEAASPKKQTDVLVPRDWKFAVPIFAAMGLAVLAKGPVGVVLPGVILILFLLISWRERDLENGLLTPPAGPWWRRWWGIAVQTLRPRQILQTLKGLHFLIGLGDRFWQSQCRGTRPLAIRRTANGCGDFFSITTLAEPSRPKRTTTVFRSISCTMSSRFMSRASPGPFSCLSRSIGCGSGLPMGLTGETATGWSPAGPASGFFSSHSPVRDCRITCCRCTPPWP